MSTSLSSLRFLALLLVALVALLSLPEASAQSGYYAASYQAAQAQAAAAYHQQQQAAAYHHYQQQQAAYYQQQQAAAAYHRQQQAAAAAAAQQQAARRAPAGNLPLRFDGRYASPPNTAPGQIHYAVAAANYIQNKPYRRGGGHANVEDSAYDCSGSVSYALIKAGLLRSPLPSSGFANYGQPGEGRFITIWVKPGDHVFMTICGLRLDTSGGSEGQGPRWRTSARSTAGFIARHPAGF